MCDSSLVATAPGTLGILPATKLGLVSMGQEKHTHRGLIQQGGTTIDNYIQLLLLTGHHNDITVSHPYYDFNSNMT